MGSIEPDGARLRAFAAAQDSGPLTMINLLRYRERAAYPEGFDAPPCSGREAYGRYGEAVREHLAAVGGRAVWLGAVRETLIAPEGEAWDDAILVEYPSRKAFLEMVGRPGYQRDAVHRTAALADSRLIATHGTFVPDPGAGDG
jgi:uncharacterized protein (DUF1330 family)